MFSYVYTKVLELVPFTCDAFIDCFSGGRSDSANRQIVSRFVESGTEALDLGCGTGSLAILAASGGARVTGVDATTST